MPDTPQSLADRLREEGGRVVHFFNHLNFDQWGILIYPQENNWSFHQLLAHFVSAEISRKELITHICDGGKRAPIDFEIDTFNQREVERLSAESNDNLLQLLTQERANIIEVMSAIFSQDLKRVGNDPYLGQVTLLEMINLTYRRLQIHLRETRQFI